MKVNILLLAVFTILLYISPSLRIFFNNYLGKLLLFLITIYFFYQSPVLGIIVVCVILIFKQYYTKDNNIPLEVVYKTKPQTPMTPLDDVTPHEYGLELLTKELNLRPTDSNRHSILQGSPPVCAKNDLLCLYDNDPHSFNENETTKYNI